MSEESTIETNEAVGAAQADSANAAGLNIQDLGAVRQIFAVAAQRGAFRAEEMEVVGRVYNKLDLFLKSLEPQPNEDEQETPNEG